MTQKEKNSYKSLKDLLRLRDHLKNQLKTNRPHITNFHYLPKTKYKFFVIQGTNYYACPLSSFQL